jgi:acyl-CoA synthetase (AMP-forming)/AMP-acid ligase II
MKSADALLTAWENTLARKGDVPAIFGRNGDALRTFNEVEARARDFACKIENFQPAEVLAIQIGNHEDWPSIFIACLRKQIVVLPLEQSITNQERDSALTICGASSVVVANPDGIVEILPLRTAASTDWRGDPPALLKLTSGTTAAPRAIRFRSTQLLADCEQICDTMGITDTDLNFGVIPISHSYGFSNLLTPLIVRRVPMVLSRDRLPRAVLVDLVRTGATVFPGMPVFYQAFCEMKTMSDFSMVRLCISAGSPLQPTIAERFKQQFGLSIHSFYGASECGGICYDRDGTNPAGGFVGQPMKNVDIEIIIPAEPSSQIRVRSAAVGDGYFPEPEDAKLGNGIFVPDDLLAHNAAGFRIVGRVSDVINVAGKKVNPAEVEGYLLGFKGVREAVVFGRDSPLRNEEVVACVVTNTDVSEHALLEFCRANLSAWQVPKRIFIVDALPVNERGKISRRELARQFSR